VRSDYGFHFRLCIPGDLKKRLRLSELRYSLKTTDMQQARYRAALLGSFVNGLLEDTRDSIRRGGSNTVDKEQLRKLVHEYIQKMLSEDEVWRIDRKGTITQDEQEQLQAAHTDLFYNSTEDLASMDLRSTFVRQHINELLEENSLPSLPSDSIDYRRLAVELLKANQVLARIFHARNEGDYERSYDLQRKHFPDTLSISQGLHETNKNKPTSDSKRFSEVVCMILEENKLTEAKTIRTVQDYRSSNGLFIELMGDLYLDEIRGPTITDFLEKLKRWPRHRSKVSAYRDLSTEQILSMDIPIENRISVRNINKHIEWVSHTLSFAVQRDMIDKNYALGRKLPDKSGKRAKDQRAAFTTEDLAALFHSKAYMEDKHKSTHAFWLPLLGLFTGARLGELAQLEAKDIQLLDDTWCFSIQPGLDEDEGSPASKERKRLKSPSSRRIIPIHSTLLDLKFLKFVQEMRDCGEARLFPGVPYRHDSYSQYYSRRFTAFKDNCGVGKGKTFHSFRHTFATCLKHNDVDYQIRGALEGHSTGTDIMERYAKDYKPSKLKRDGIDKLFYEGLDLSHLKRSRFVTNPHERVVEELNRRQEKKNKKADLVAVQGDDPAKRV
jgi:integrase